MSSTSGWAVRCASRCPLEHCPTHPGHARMRSGSGDGRDRSRPMTSSRPGWIPLLSAVLLATMLALAASRLVVAADPLLVVNQVSVERFPEITVYFTAVDSSGLPITDVGKDRLQVLHNGRSVPDLSLDLAET